MTKPSNTKPSVLQVTVAKSGGSVPLRRFVDLLGLLAHAATFLWIPLLAWGLVERWNSEPAPTLTQHVSPSPRSPIPLPAEVGLPLLTPSAPQNPALGDLGLRAHKLAAQAIPASLAVALATPQPHSSHHNAPLTPTLSLPLRGVSALGGDITLDDLKAKPVPIAVRAERLMWSRSQDPLTPLPRQWRDEMRTALPAEARQVEAQVVRVPAPHLKQPEEVPMAIDSRGDGWTLVTPASPASRQLVEQWASRQTPPPEGSGRAVVVTLEPIDTLPPESESGTITSSLPPEPPSR